MVKKKSKVQKITLKSIFRLIIFILIVYGLISVLSREKGSITVSNDPTLYIGENVGGQILGTVYSKLPPDSRNQLENFDQTLLGKLYFDSSKYISEQLNGFPKKQINQLKKDLINKISQDLINNIDSQ